MVSAQTRVSALLALGCLSAQVNAATLVYHEPLAVVAGKADGIAEDPVAVHSLAFEAFGQRFDLDLEPNRSVINAAVALPRRDEVSILRGRIRGNDRSWVRLVIDRGEPTGLISDGDEIYAVDSTTVEAEGPQIYRLSDLLLEPGTVSCAAPGGAVSAAELVTALESEAQPVIEYAAGASVQIDVSILADAAFSADHGSGSEAALIARMNNVDGIFSSQLGVQLSVGLVEAFTSNDPFSGTTDAETLLDEIVDYRLATPAQQAYGLTHLFTGNNLDGTTVGVAYSEAICSTGFAAGLTQGTHGTTVDSLIAAHEIGHNFGAPHDGTAGSACEAEPQTFLMAPSINGSDEFSACSLTQMQAIVASASCVTSIGSPDLAVLASGPQPVLFGDSATVEIELNNVGAGVVDDATIDVSIPTGAQLESVSIDGGACTIGAATVTCQPGAISPGSGSTLTLLATPTVVGELIFDASLVSAADSDPTNNQIAVTVTTMAVVDVAVVAPAGQTLELNQSTTVDVIIENRGSLDATQIVATVTPPAELNVSAATPSTGTCTVSQSVASCDLPVLGAGQNLVLSLEVAGIDEGVHSYSVAVAPSEQDRLVGNNSTVGQVTVTVPASASPNPEPSAQADSGSGGGSFGWPAALMIILGGWLRRRPSIPM